MATQVQFRGGTTSQHGSFTGAVREVTVDTDKETLVVHDGSTAGGFALLRQSGSQPLTITTADNNAQLTIVSTDADGSSGAILEIQRDSGSPADGDAIGQIKFTADNDAGQSTLYGTINGTLRDASDGTEDGQMQFSTMVNGSTTDFFRYGVGGDGETGVIFNEGSIDADFRVESNVNTHALFVQGSDGVVGIGTSSPNTNGVHVEKSASNAMGVTVSNTEGTGSRFDLYAFGSSPTIQSAHRNAIYQWTGNGIDLWSRTGDLQFGTVNALSMKIDASGAVTKPLQPAFHVMKTSSQANISTGSNHEVTFQVEAFDQNSDYDNTNHRFNAPVTGKYFFHIALRLADVDTSVDYYLLKITTSNRNHISLINPKYTADVDFINITISVLADMDASDTASVQLFQSAGSAQTDIVGDSSYSYFSGFLAC